MIMTGCVVSKKSIVCRTNRELNGYFLTVKLGNENRLYPVLKSDFDRISKGDMIKLDRCRGMRYTFIDMVC